ncbi:MAG: hypothetical protein DLM52_12640 [Chthoniobacterales bacterium]|nr:MAG: hypothetical protein DLM52_12640 [Chthoniobacterales bacterium]
MSSSAGEFVLLRTFRETFEGKRYNHRNSTLGDFVASHLYEDLVTLDRSALLTERVHKHERVVNVGNKTVGKPSRRGDGTFGELIPTAVAITESGLLVARGEIATIEIGVETKILAKAMIKQIDRVIGDLVRQVEQFKSTGGNPICVGLVGVNFASRYTGYEGAVEWPTDGKKHKHPIQEAEDAERRVLARAAPAFDEFQILRFRAENTEPFAFEWVDYTQTAKEYGALLVRLSREYDRRFK